MTDHLRRAVRYLILILILALSPARGIRHIS